MSTWVFNENRCKYISIQGIYLSLCESLYGYIGATHYRVSYIWVQHVSSVYMAFIHIYITYMSGYVGIQTPVCVHIIHRLRQSKILIVTKKDLYLWNCSKIRWLLPTKSLLALNILLFCCPLDILEVILKV